MNGHGGNVYRLAKETGMPERSILDFSASINPLGVSDRVRAELIESMDDLARYPDPDATALRRHVARYHDIDQDHILCGNGSTELIYLIARVLRPGKVLVTAPTFLEYERASQASSRSVPGGENTERREKLVKHLYLEEETAFAIDPNEFTGAMEGCDAAFLCNPNNPTGGLVKKEDVLTIAEAARDARCYLIVDEAFIDFCPEESVVRSITGNPFLIVLRSMTKFHALTGLRIGYGVFPVHLSELINKVKEPWTVNTLAQRAAIEALGDERYREETFNVISKEKIFLEEEFVRRGIRYLESAANYYLLKIEGASRIHEKLRTKGVLTRDCSDFRGLDGSYIRIAVRSRNENAALLDMISEIMKNEYMTGVRAGNERVHET